MQYSLKVKTCVVTPENIKKASIQENLSSGVCHQVRLIPTCSATKTTNKNEKLHLANVTIILSRERIAKPQTRLHRCSGWSATVLFACNKIRFSHNDEAHIMCTVNVLKFRTLLASQKGIDKQERP